MRALKSQVKGHYWMTNTCLNSTTAACATSMLVFAIQEASPNILTLGDGYMGLAPGIGDLADSQNNLLEQMFKHGMISKKQFGVHTHMWNSTDDPSMIRFGGYDETSFKKRHRQVWLNTLNSTTWEI